MREFPQWQVSVARFVEAHQLEAPVPVRLLDLVAEVGELAKEALKGTGYGRDEFRPSEEWAEELADAVFAPVCVANSTGVQLEAALEGALAKYRGGSRAGDVGSGR